MPTKFQKQAANKVDNLFSANEGDPRYLKNMTGEGSGQTATGPSIPMKKIADARALARSGTPGTKYPEGSRPVADAAKKKLKLLDALTRK